MQIRPSLINHLLLLLVLCSACRPEASPINPAPPQLGWGDLEATLSIFNGETVVTAYLTRGLANGLELPLSFSGTAIENVDYTLPDGDVLRFLPGESAATLRLRTDGNPANDRIDKSLQLSLPTTGSALLAELRDTLTITFALEQTVDLSIWVPTGGFPQLWAYTSFGPDPVPSTGNPGRHFAFVYASRTRPNTIGLTGNDPSRSTNALNIGRIYEDISANSSGVQLPNLIELIPESEGATRGTARIIPQEFFVRRLSSSDLPDFTIGISGEGGTYDEETGIILLGIHFDETDIGGPADTLRNYSFESMRR